MSEDEKDCQEINLSGRASCAAEGLSIPWFFLELRRRESIYDLNVQLKGECLTAEPTFDIGQGMPSCTALTVH